MRNAIRCAALAAIVGAMLGCAIADNAQAYDGEIDAPDAVDVQPDETDPWENMTTDALSGAEFMQAGVVDYDGHSETWYSSQVLYHYRTPEWTADDEGFYRTAEGYYVVASDAWPEGAVIETSRGLAQVLDGGCGDNVDFYCNWSW